ncbi:MAG TPA: diguanylate cyclase [Allosphingosinicella sp.]|nr:diguanylate cyclase [Allosphingosinicella sp.]
MINVRLPRTPRGKFLHDLDSECALLQPPRHGNANWLVLIRLAEWEALRDHLGAYGCSAIMQAVSDIVSKGLPESQRVLQTFAGEITIVVRDRSEAELDQLLTRLSRKIVSHRFVAGGEPVRVTPAIGFAAFSEERTSRSGLRCARSALEHSLAHLDLRPVPFSDLLEQPSVWQEWMIRFGVRRSIRFGVRP